MKKIVNPTAKNENTRARKSSVLCDIAISKLSHQNIFLNSG